MKKFLFITKEVWVGKSVLRAFLNYRLKDEILKGKIIDVGGGGGDNYISFVGRAEGASFETFDLKVGKQVDFETDNLPANSDSFDTVLFLNVMEHIYNHQHIANEVVRILKRDGRLIGFVPFLMWYHPDHRDYFRYTHEALRKILTAAEAKNVEVEHVGIGPFMAAAHITVLSFPKYLRMIPFFFLYGLDLLYIALKKHEGNKYALGYYFTLTK